MDIGISRIGSDIISQAKRRLLRLVSRLTAEEMIDRIEFLSAWGASDEAAIPGAEH